MAKASIKLHGEGARLHAPQAGRAVAPRPPPLVRLGEVSQVNYGTRIRSKDSTSDAYPVYGGGGKTFGWAEFNRENQCVVSRFAMSEECVRFVSGKFFLNDSGLTVDADDVNIQQEYLNWFLLGHQREIYSLGRGCAQKNLRVDSFLDMQIPLPPLPEQKRIAAILDKICEMKRNAEARLQKLDLLVKARFVEMFGDGKSPAQRLGDIAEITGGLTKNGKRKSLPLKYKYLRVANVFFNRLDLSDVQEIGVEEAEVCKALLKKDDLLFVEGNGSIEQVGRVALWSGEIDPCLHQNHLIKARFSAGIIPQYALFFFMNEVGRQQIKECAVSTTGLHTLSTGKVANLRLPLPPLALQRQFAAFVEKVEGLKATAKKELEQVDLLYRAKLQEFFG